MGPDGYTSKEVAYCPDLRESSNRFGICSVKKPRTLSWINTERLRSDIFARISTRNIRKMSGCVSFDRLFVTFLGGDFAMILTSYHTKGPMSKDINTLQ